MSRTPRVDAEIVVKLDARREHALRNQFTIILGVCEALAVELPAEHAVRADVSQIHAAATAAMSLIEEGRAR